VTSVSELTLLRGLDTGEKMTQRWRPTHSLTHSLTPYLTINMLIHRTSFALICYLLL
jgi:hypothetical protein